MVKRRVSLKDIAMELGVSISTVSRGLRDHPDISEEMREKEERVRMGERSERRGDRITKFE